MGFDVDFIAIMVFCFWFFVSGFWFDGAGFVAPSISGGSVMPTRWSSELVSSPIAFDLISFDLMTGGQGGQIQREEDLWVLPSYLHRLGGSRGEHAPQVRSWLMV